MSAKREPRVRRWELVSDGYCIRCRAPIGGDPERPLCRACDGVDASESGAYCLACGDPAPTSTRDPVCRPCRDRLYA